MDTTSNIGLKVWNDPSDEFNPQDLEDNWNAIDAQFSPTATDVVPSRFIESGTTLPLTSLSDGRMFYLTAADQGFPAKTLARYDGSAWRAVGPTEVNSTLPVANLYGGRTIYLTAATGGFPANTLVVYNGTTTSWEEIGGVEIAATVPATNLYAGRAVVLTAADGGFDAYSLIVYNGSAWVRTEKRGVETGAALPGSPYTGQIFALTGATGNFLAGDIVRWDGASWSKVGPGPQYISVATFGTLTPSDGKEVLVQVDPTNGINWGFRYRSASLSAYKWEFTGGPPMFANVDTSETLSTTGSFVDLTTVGPSIILPFAGDYEITHFVRIVQTGSGSGNAITAVNTGGGPVSPSGIATVPASGVASVMANARYNALAASATVKLQYNTTISGTGFLQRWIQVKPIRIS